MSARQNKEGAWFVSRRSLFVWTLAASMGAFMAASPGAQATSGGCFLPTLAVSEYVDFFVGAVDQSSDTRTCERQCRDFFRGCKKVVAASNRCLRSGFIPIFNAEKRNCTEFSGSNRTLCQQDIRDDKNDAGDFLKDELDAAKIDCGSEADDCLASCSGV